MSERVYRAYVFVLALVGALTLGMIVAVLLQGAGLRLDFARPFGICAVALLATLVLHGKRRHD
jgi:hypothetical protein